MGAAARHYLQQMQQMLMPSSGFTVASTTALQSLKTTTSILPSLIPAWQQITSLLPNLIDVQLLAVPKHKVRRRLPLQKLIEKYLLLVVNFFIYTPTTSIRHIQVSPHRKGNRSAHKHLRFIPLVSQCSKCERVFPPHSMPSKCEDEECPAFNVRARPGGASSGEEDSAVGDKQ